MKKFLIPAIAAGALFASATAFAADLPSRKAAPAPAYAPPSFTWTGFYAGLNAGYAWGSIRSGGALANVYQAPSGFIGGGQIGYNYQTGQWVFGVETDLQYSDLNGKANPAGFGLVSRARLDYFGTLRARAGVAFDRFLVYGTGGLAYGKTSFGLTPAGALVLGVPGITGADQTHTGYTVGGGVEYAFTNNLTAKVEYLYTDLEKKRAFAGSPAKSGMDFSTLRAGVNVKF